MYYVSASNKWGVFCEDGVTEIPAGEKFFVLAKPSQVGYNVDMSFTFSPPTDDFSDGTLIDHPLLNNHPEAIFMATHDYSTLFDHTLTTYYRPTDNQWVLVSENQPVTFAGHDFNIVVSMPAPVNDLCEDATTLNVGGSFADQAIVGNLLGSDGTTFGSVWYKATVPATGHLTIETDYNAGSAMNGTWMYVYKGVCGGLTYLGFDNNSGNGNFAKKAITDQTPGEVIYIKIERDSTAEPCDSFLISAYDPSLGIADAVIDGFSMYPNPVEDMLNIQTTNPIKAISIYNMLGQEVINTSKTQIDMSALQAGNQIGAYSLIKQ
jgi:hypothetical protein